jgi:phosphoenolpyruvate-protein kinase (PTS system EI component)
MAGTITSQPHGRWPVSALQASPFVPGIATGILQRHSPSTSSSILLLPFEALGELTELPAGLIIIGGAPLAHPMIRLYGYGIPSVVISAEQVAQLQEGAMIRLDGYSGWLSDLDEASSQDYPEITPPPPGQPVSTADGIAIELRASVADAQGVANAVANGASAIGMVRSEFLFPKEGRPPDEAFYLSALQPLCDQAGRLPVTVRTLDLAPDKHPAWLGELPGMTGPLGLRGARLYAHEPVKSVFHAELRALARLAPAHDIRLLLPYMTRPEEFAPLREQIVQRLNRPIPLGVMIETPAAALALPEWLKLVDFVVIGCNDLMQCLFAADRDVPAVAPLLDPYAPVLYRFLRQMAHAASGELQRVQLGGLLPQVPGVLPLLIGIGYRNFSVEPLLTPCLARIAASTDSAAAEGLVNDACAASNAAEVRELLGLPGTYQWGGAMG